MIVPINKKWRIRTTPHCWQVEKMVSVNKEGEENWEPKTYHTTLEGAGTTVVDEMIRAIPDDLPIEKVLKKMKAIRVEVMELLRPI